MTTTITAAMALDILTQVVADLNPHKTYGDVVTEHGSDQDQDAWLSKSCRYANSEDRSIPLCIVGQVYARLGVTIPLEVEGMTVTDAAFIHGGIYIDEGKEDVFEDAKGERYTLTADATNILRAAQRAQDHGSTFGVALEAAHAAAPRA